jgi:signal transduction histidine kinase
VLIYQLFYNLVNNALKFSKPDVPPRILFHSTIINRNHADMAEITISDNGIGIEQQYAEQIFNAFARLHAKDQYEGTGLGLALCKKIVERHRGSISATGIKGEGATFTVMLPIRQTQKII